jgi:hypothetical protein
VEVRDLGAGVGAPLGYWTFQINQDGFEWYSLFPGAVAALMAISLLGMLLPSSEEPLPEEEESGPEVLVRPPAGDINASQATQTRVLT